jgi:hypothetical protein
MGKRDFRVVIKRPTRGDQVASELLGESFVDAPQPGARRAVEVAGLDVIGERRLGRPRRPGVTLAGRQVSGNRGSRWATCPLRTAKAVRSR